MRLHDAAPVPITLTESSMAYRLQVGRSGLKMFLWPGTAYLADKLHHPAELEFRRRLRSASSHELSVPPYLPILSWSEIGRRSWSASAITAQKNGLMTLIASSHRQHRHYMYSSVADIVVNRTI